MEDKVELIKENNDFFRDWIIEEWKHHNTVDEVYQLRIIKPEELTFQENEEKELYLYRFFIEETSRNKGIGTIALNKIIDMARKQNKDMTLEVMGENIARDLYERLGFKTHYRRMVLKINDDIYEN